jgi:5-methyltetrahydropteroyltriglutamate--homocysteine methyltransferase
VLGPVSLLRLSKTLDGTDPLALLPRLLPLYADLFELLHHSGVDWLQFDEPCLALDLDPELQAAYAQAFDTLRASPGPRLLLTCGFGDPRPALPWIRRLAPAALHADLSAGLAPLPPAAVAGVEHAAALPGDV